jgi:hypothetical protein
MCSANFDSIGGTSAGCVAVGVSSDAANALACFRKECREALGAGCADDDDELVHASWVKRMLRSRVLLQTKTRLGKGKQRPGKTFTAIRDERLALTNAAIDQPC